MSNELISAAGPIKIIDESRQNALRKVNGMAFRTLAYIEQMKPAEIIECTYTIGQEDCIYSFC